MDRIANVLKKPLAHFLPHLIYDFMISEEMRRHEQELPIQFERIWTDGLKKLAIRQVRAIADLDTREFRNGIRQAIAEIENQDTD